MGRTQEAAIGYGDEILNSGWARGAAERGKRIAFGDGRKIIWHRNAYEIFRDSSTPQGYNRNVAPPGSERDPDVEWIFSYPGLRPYCQMRPLGRYWDFRAGQQKVGELFFDQGEKAFAEAFASRRLVIIEPNTKHQAPNKRWPHERYATVARFLAEKGYRVAQFATGGMALAGVQPIRTGSFRLAAAVLQRARLYVGPEGGLHHAAAAVGTQAVVIFGGYISPAVTGYASHVNLFSGKGLGCGNINECRHCRDAMAKISVGEVMANALRLLEGTINDHQPTHHTCSVRPSAGGDRVGSVREPARYAGGNPIRLHGVLE